MELHGDRLLEDSLINLRAEMLKLKDKLNDSQSRLVNLFKNFYPNDRSVTAFRHFITFMAIVDDLRIKANSRLEHIAKIRNPSAEGLAALENYITKCEQFKASWSVFFSKEDRLRH
ncbi:hypothetical protein [Rickettsia endosymbiont of Polydrusus tereticollis]|uniref:hypothetical protein n=1 Tax=Rickettsia endosymbiont of Polydrusus tereticollis TaxID=3066251 RepID=UPI003133424D